MRSYGHKCAGNQRGFLGFEPDHGGGKRVHVDGSYERGDWCRVGEFYGDSQCGLYGDDYDHARWRRTVRGDGVDVHRIGGSADVHDYSNHVRAGDADGE